MTPNQSQFVNHLLKGSVITLGLLCIVVMVALLTGCQLMGGAEFKIGMRNDNVLIVGWTTDGDKQDNTAGIVIDKESFLLLKGPTDEPQDETETPTTTDTP